MDTVHSPACCGKPKRKRKTAKQVWNNIRLKLTLFRIWFFKNSMSWVIIFCTVCVICLLAGKITASTPFLGKVIYPIFSPLIDEIVLIIEDEDLTNIMDFFAASISILVSIGVFVMKTKSIAQSDIKSDKLKIALISANLYFNSDGRLVKKVEKMTQTDINGDGLIDEEKMDSEELHKGPFSRFIDGIKEFIIIAKTDFSGTDEENKKEYDATMNKAELKKSKEGLEEVRAAVTNGTLDYISDKSVERLDNEYKDTINDESLTLETKVKKMSSIEKTKEWFKTRKELRKQAQLEKELEKEKKKAEEEASKEEPEKVEEPIKEEPKVEEKKPEVAPVVKTEEKKLSNDVQDYLNKLFGN